MLQVADLQPETVGAHVDRGERTGRDFSYVTLANLEEITAALEAYAAKYETALDKRLSVKKLRTEVASLIEQFGVR